MATTFSAEEPERLRGPQHELLWCDELEQLPPPQPWQVWMFLAGRGAGKTRSGSEWIRENVRQGVKRIGLIAPTAGDSRDVMVEGSSGILEVCWNTTGTLKAIRSASRCTNPRPLSRGGARSRFLSGFGGLISVRIDGQTAPSAVSASKR
jgi:phage terminase large subunit-like protein